MTAATTTIADFILGRVADDEAEARAATAGPWQHNPRKEWFTDPDKVRAASAGVPQSGGKEYVAGSHASIGAAATGPSDDEQSMADARHIARHDPARVLDECKTKRTIVELHRAEPFADDPGITYCVICHESSGGDHPCDTLRALASVYADHTDFDPRWSL